MKICFVIPSLTSGGAERVAVTVLSALDRYERVLYIFSAADGVYFDRIAPGVQVVIARERSWLRRASATTTEALRRIGELYAIEAQIRGQPPDQRREIRQQQARPLLDSLELWLRERLR